MCGILGQIDWRHAPDPNRFARALDTLAPRGPDSAGVEMLEDGRVALGHRRLSIVDLSDAGRQPMCNEDGTIWLTCNGEIYNHPSLRNRLEGLGHRFSSNSDSETIIHAYEQWGDQCVDRLLGMFAFAVWDGRRKRLFAARDHIGIKPFCFADLPDGIVFASTLDAVLPLLPFEPELDAVAAAYALITRTIPSPLAIWRGASKLDPGHYLIWTQETGVDVRQWWEPPSEIDHGTDCSLERWRELFHEVLQDHLMADVPVGLFLSAGLDSTSIAAGLSAIRAKPTTFTVSIPSFAGNEAPVAEKTASLLEFPCNSVHLDAQTCESVWESTFAAYDEPECDDAPVPVFLISRHAASYVKVVLAGDGGDECFGGYPWHHPVSPWTGTVQSLLRSPCYFCLQSLRRLRQHMVASSPAAGRARFPMRQLSSYKNPFESEDVERLLAPTGVRFDDEIMLRPLERFHVRTLPKLRAMQRIDLMNFCAELCLPKVDRASMAHSLEVRVPFLDRRVIEWALRKPVEANERGAQQSKPLLRRYVTQHGLGHVLAQKKSGFSTKNAHLRAFRDYADCIEHGSLVQLGVLDDCWRAILSPSGQPSVRRAFLLWCLSQWYEHHKQPITECV